MTRMLWQIVSFLAVVHLLMLAMFVGWLWQSGRLNRERVLEVRSMFAQTIDEEMLAAQDASADAALQEQAMMQQKLRDNPPRGSAEQVAFTQQQRTSEHQTIRRLQDEKRILLAQLHEANRQIDANLNELEKQRASWETSADAVERRKNDEQFDKIVRQYESVAPKLAKAMLVNLVEAGETENAVAYLDAMKLQARTPVLEQFKTDTEQELATQLLERLKQLRRNDAAGEDSNDAESIVSADPPDLQPPG